MGTDENDVTTFLKDKLLYSIRSLSEIGEELSSTEDFESSSRAILHLIMGTLITSKAAIMLFDQESGELAVAVSRGLSDTSMRLRLNRDLVRVLHATAEPFFVGAPPDPVLRLYFEKNRDELKKLHSHIWIPLRVKSSFLGVISVSKRFKGKEYEQVDMELLTIIARQLSIAISNFSLLGNLKETNFKLNRKILELETLYDLGIAIGALMEVRELSEQILINAVGLTDASAGLLVLKKENKLILASSINLPSDDLSALEKSEPIGALLNKGEPWLDNSADPAANPFGFRKLLVVPMLGQHEVEGLIGLGDKESRDRGLLDFSDEDKRLLQNFASQAGVAIENARLFEESLEKGRLERELQVAASIQQNLLPDSPPDIPNFEIVATTVPSRVVGGDHYDFIFCHGQHLISIADVSGKGIPAALLVSTLHATLHAHCESEQDLKKIVQRVSRSVYASSLSNKFITFVLARLDPERMTLTSVNAGHNYPLVVSQDGRITSLQCGGICLGLLQESEYEEETIKLNPGDLLIFYTDGVTEAFNPEDEEFSEERLKHLLLENRHSSARKIFDQILSEIEEFTAGAPPHDDLTLIVIKVASD